MLHHAVRINAESGFSLRLGLSLVQMCMRLELNQAKNGFLSRFARSMNSMRGAEKLLVHRLHALLGERTGVRAALLAPLAEARIFSRSFGDGRRASEHAPRTEAQFELGILRIIGMLRLVLGVQMVEVAEELIETMHRRQKFIAVAEVVLAELSGHIALGLE